jgi:hypothetical protein
MDGISINEQSIILNRLTAIHEIPGAREKAASPKEVAAAGASRS